MTELLSLQAFFGPSFLRLAGKRGLLREDLKISYLLIFMCLVAIVTSVNYGCGVIQIYGLYSWKEIGEYLTILVIRNYFGYGKILASLWA